MLSRQSDALLFADASHTLNRQQSRGIRAEACAGPREARVEPGRPGARHRRTGVLGLVVALGMISAQPQQKSVVGGWIAAGSFRERAILIFFEQKLFIFEEMLLGRRRIFDLNEVRTALIGHEQPLSVSTKWICRPRN